MQPKLIVTFERLGESDFLARAGSILAALTGNSHFPEPWAAEAPTLAQLTVAFNAYRDAFNASLTRDTVKISQRVTARQSLTDLLKQLATYLELAAHGNVDALGTSGYEMRHDIVRGRSLELLPAPSDLRLSHGTLSGTLNVRAAKLAGAASYELETAAGDPTIEDNWKHVSTTPGCSHILVEGLTPGQTCWVRLRAIGRTGAGPWTPAASLMVI